MKKLLAYLFLALFILGSIAVIGCEMDEDFDDDLEPEMEEEM